MKNYKSSGFLGETLDVLKNLPDEEIEILAAHICHFWGDPNHDYHASGTRKNSHYCAKGKGTQRPKQLVRALLERNWQSL